jgi:hypothetical protein
VAEVVQAANNGEEPGERDLIPRVNTVRRA